MTLNDEEKDVYDKVCGWMKNEWPEWRDMGEGYFEACVLANLLQKFARVILENAPRSN